MHDCHNETRKAETPELKLVSSITEMQEIRQSFCKSKSIGFVPTMGYLHQGHLSLVEASTRACEITIVSIFVNPMQFGAGEDLGTYPRDLERDIELLSAYDVDYVFYPDAKEMYPAGFGTKVEIPALSTGLCGASRPGHFTGVATVVLKLVNITRPTQMFMGIKDFQQTAVLRAMLKDLNLQTEIIACPIVREPDGLALSSRNVYLDAVQRVQALCLHNAIKLIQALYADGITDSNQLIDGATDLISEAGGQVDYIQIVDSTSLTELPTANDNCRIVLAVFIGRTRLIDNAAIRA